MYHLLMPFFHLFNSRIISHPLASCSTLLESFLEYNFSGLGSKLGPPSLLLPVHVCNSCSRFTQSVWPTDFLVKLDDIILD